MLSRPKACRDAVKPALIPQPPFCPELASELSVRAAAWSCPAHEAPLEAMRTIHAHGAQGLKYVSTGGPALGLRAEPRRQGVRGWGKRWDSDAARPNRPNGHRRRIEGTGLPHEALCWRVAAGASACLRPSIGVRRSTEPRSMPTGGCKVRSPQVQYSSGPRTAGSDP